MTRLRTLIVMLLALLALPAVALAHPADGDSLAIINGRVFTKSGIDVHSIPFPFVRLICGRDTVSTSGGADGAFTFNNVVPGKKKILATQLSFKPTLMEVEVLPGSNAFMVEMTEDPKVLEAAGIVGKIAPITQKGDTLIYNAAAVKTMDGENALEILRQMPGVEIKENSIFVNGQKVERAYVNGLLLFGNDPMAPLNSILAEDVTNIRTYEEQSVESRLRGEKQGEKDRVLDIRTKEPLVSAWDAYAQAGVGADEKPKENGDIQGRYFAGVNANFFSETFLVYANVFSNNLGLDNNRQDVLGFIPSQNKYHRTTYAAVGTQRFWGDRLLGNSYRLNYSYTADNQNDFTRSLQTYLDQGGDIAREVSDTTQSTSSSGRHRINGDITVRDPLLKSLFVITSWSLDETNNRTLRTQWDRTASSQTAYREDIGDAGSNLSGFAHAVWTDYTANPSFIPSVEANLTVNPTQGRNWIVDTTASSISRRYISSEAGGNNISADTKLSASIKLVNNDKVTSNLYLGYFVAYNRNQRRQMAFDLYDEFGALPQPVTNEVNTYHFTRNYFEHGPSAALVYRTKTTSLTALFQAGFATQKDKEFYPAAIGDNRSFFLPRAHITAAYKKLRLTYVLTSGVPATEQYRDRLDDSNPLFLTVGNPDLNRSLTHFFDAGYNIMLVKMASQIQFSAKGHIYTDNIVSRRVYRPEAAYLEHFDYTTQPGATLTTYENCNGAWDIDTYAMMSSNIKAMGAWIYTSVGITGGQKPYFAGDEKVFIRDFEPHVGIQTRFRPSKQLSLHFNAESAYLQSKNSLDQTLTRAMRNSLSGDVVYNAGKYLVFTSKYTLSNHTFLEGGLPSVTHHFLRAGAGVKLMKGRLKITLTGNDLLNNGASYSIVTAEDHTLQSWTPTAGRFYMLTATFRLNKLQPTTKYKGESSNGNMREVEGDLKMLFH